MFSLQNAMVNISKIYYCGVAAFLTLLNIIKNSGADFLDLSSQLFEAYDEFLLQVWVLNALLFLDDMFRP